MERKPDMCGSIEKEAKARFPLLFLFFCFFKNETQSLTSSATLNKELRETREENISGGSSRVAAATEIRTWDNKRN